MRWFGAAVCNGPVGPTGPQDRQPSTLVVRELENVG